MESDDEDRVNTTTKYFLFGYTAFFWFAGTFVFIIGLWALSEKGYFDNVKEVTFAPVDPVPLLISLSSITIVVSLLGCIGALRENLSLLQLFYIFLGMLLVVEFALAITGFASSSWMEHQFGSFVNSTIRSYRDDPDLQDLIDFTQSYLMCCGGSRGPSDWDNNIYFNCSSSVLINGIPFVPNEACGVPYSCCLAEGSIIKNTHCGFGVRKLSVTEQTTLIYSTGCISSFEDWIKVHLFSLASIILVVAFLQAIPLILSYKLIADIEVILIKQGKISGFNYAQSAYPSPFQEEYNEDYRYQLDQNNAISYGYQMEDNKEAIFEHKQNDAISYGYQVEDNNEAIFEHKQSNSSYV